MDNKSLMLQGKEFFTGDPILMADKAGARTAAAEYNAITDTETDAAKKRQAKLREIFGGCGSNPFIKPPFRCDYGYRIFVGDNFFANFDCVFLDAGKIVFGDNCMVGPKSMILAITHPLDPVARSHGVGIPKDVIIGNNVWLGAGVTILPGVTLGDNVVVGAGSVVTKSFPADVVIAGNPARIIEPHSSGAIDSDMQDHER